MRTPNIQYVSQLCSIWEFFAFWAHFQYRVVIVLCSSLCRKNVKCFKSTELTSHRYIIVYTVRNVKHIVCCDGKILSASAFKRTPKIIQPKKPKTSTNYPPTKRLSENFLHTISIIFHKQFIVNSLMQIYCDPMTEIFTWNLPKKKNNKSWGKKENELLSLLLMEIILHLFLLFYCFLKRNSIEFYGVFLWESFVFFLFWKKSSVVVFVLKIQKGELPLNKSI